MKKLMTMIAAVATAFGLYATDFAKHTISFTGMTDGQYDLSENEGTTGLYWTYDGQAKGGYTPSDDLKVESNVLTIKTGSKVLSRKFLATGETADFSKTNVFVDAYINFKDQALDEIPTMGDDTKLALFVLNTADMEGVDQANIGTNLYLVAGYGAGQKALYRLAVTVDEDFLANDHRVTVKAYGKALKAGRAGFMLYLDGASATATPVMAEAMCVAAANADFDLSTPMADAQVAGYTGFASNAFEPSLSGWVNAYSLFLSKVAVSGLSLTSVDFVGQAALASVELTGEQPGFIPADAKFVTIDTALEYMVTVAGQQVTPEDGKIYGNGGEAVVITVTSDLTGKVLTSTEGEVEDNVITYTFVVNDTITIAAVDAAAYVDGKAYATFGEALNAANRKGSEALLKLAGDYDADADDGDGSFKITGNVVLDLAGHTIKGTGGERAGCVIENGGTLTITNSTDTMGKVLPLGNNVAAVKNGNGKTLTIEAGMFDGEIAQVNTGTINVNDGSFLVKPEGATIPSTKKWCEEAEKVDGYWVLVDKPTEINVPTAVENLTYTGEELTGVEEGTGYTLSGDFKATNAGDYEATATLAAGYIWSDGETGTKTIPWSIAAKEVTPAIAFDPDTAEWVSGGSLPTPAVSFGADTLVLNTDYTVAWDKDYPEKNPTENVVVTYTVSPVTGSNYTFTEAKKTFTVTPAEEEEPVVPGEDITTDKTPAEINADPTLKEKLLKAPVGVETTKDYLDLFKAVDGTEPGKVKFVLTEAAEATLATEVANETKAIEVAKIADGTDTTIAIENATKGLYYTLNAAATLEGIAAVDEVLCTDGTVTFTKGVQGTTSDTARFFKVSVSATPAAE